MNINKYLVFNEGKRDITRFTPSQLSYFVLVVCIDFLGPAVARRLGFFMSFRCYNRRPSVLSRGGKDKVCGR